MSPPFHSTQLRTAFAVLVSTVASVGVFAQYTTNSDPFVQMRTNMGQQVSNPGNSERIDYLTVNFPSFTFRREFFSIPPAPPALGAELASDDLKGLARSPAFEFAGEIFYSGYATLSALRQVPARQVERAVAYRTNRQRLVEEIELKFDAVAGAEPSVRRAELGELANRQDAALRALAGEAEDLRSDLARTLSFQGVNLWGGVYPRDFLELFSAVYQYAGLSTEQRLLLQEVAYQTGAPGPDGGVATLPAGSTAYFYFLPATARIRLPSDLPQVLDEKIRAFTREKESLKAELRSAVRHVDFFVWQRTQRFTALAQAQAPRFAALENLAEEIRVGLANFTYPDAPGQMTLPAELTQRVGTFYAEKVAVQREILTRLRKLRSDFPAARFDLARQGDGLGIVQTDAGTKPVVNLTEFNVGLARRYSSFAKESEVLRRDIQRYTETRPDRKAGTVDQLAADFARAYSAQETWHRYRTYYLAVMEPGLSVAQRRVLFQSAVVTLRQQL